MKLLIALQFWSGDREQAMRLAQLIAENEPARRDDVMFCFFNRSDCEPVDRETLGKMLMKMDAFSRVSMTVDRETDWPDACNAMAIDVLRQSAFQWKFGPWHDISGVLLLEPDCIPIARDWIDQVKKEWAAAFIDGKWLMGTWRDGGGDLGHINGNMVVRPDFAQLVDFTQVYPGLAWDCALAPQLHTHWQVTYLMCNRWKERKLCDEIIQVHRDAHGSSIFQKPVLVHGVKDDSVWDYAKRVLTP